MQLNKSMKASRRLECVYKIEWPQPVAQGALKRGMATGKVSGNGSAWSVSSTLSWGNQYWQPPEHTD